MIAESIYMNIIMNLLVSKSIWHLQFSKMYITTANIKAFQSTSGVWQNNSLIQLINI
jgi:hypothetical protein